ncbi:SIR2 family protein [Agrobacterium salinitolerans]|uniref:SIR2 family protein n=1 Tax=Agrobacterium salinitolerans TaxID=1183413 RepID=UPI00157276E6|nr:SIR2 family protein [Agrobacterium salinitolerans]NTA40354.1 hypothetical protein [Agrobacterium salinitolerans]
MKFIEGGAEIPDDLIDAVLAGDVVFLCGAGVSKGAGLPLFDELTSKIYLDLGETYEHDAAERESFTKQEFDRTLRALEKRVRRPGSPRSPVRTSCAKHLQVPPAKKFPHHSSVLVLSRDNEGRSRVLTTNFDTLFERAAADRNEEWFSEAVKGLPKPGGPRDFGIHHLHGRIADAKLGLSESELILTSADFGDAYLRDGWASRYVEDRMRTATLVLLGYRAEDAALRLLLETLDVDRERFPDLKKVYALERRAPDSAAQWKAKGVTPIEFPSHEAIYETLSAWAEYAERPVEFERLAMTRIFKKSPTEATEFDRAQLSSLKGRGNAPALLIESNPSLVWLPTLTEVKMIRHDERWLAGWIQGNLQDYRAVTAVVAQLGFFGPGVADALSYSLEQYKGELPPILRKSWSILIRHMRRVQPSPASGWYDLLPVLKRGEITADAIKRLTDLMTPELEVSRRFTLDDNATVEPSSVHDLMRIEFEPEENVALDEILDAWPVDCGSEADHALLTALSHGLDRAIASATDLGLEGDWGYGLADVQVASVADHPQNRHRKGFVPIVRMIAEIWSRLARKQPDLALEFIAKWVKSPYRVNHRIALYACRDRSVGADMVNGALMAISADEIFLTGCAVETHRLLVERFRDIDPEARALFEQRLREGPASASFKPDTDQARYIDRARFDVIGNLLRDGVGLSQETNAVYRVIVERHPEWGLRPQAQAGFHRWFEMSAERPIGDPKAFEGVSDDKLVEAALTEDATERWQDGQNWRQLCEQEPDRALRALHLEGAANRWRSGAWRDFLLANSRDDAVVNIDHITEELLRWPSAEFPQVASFVADWLGTGKLLECETYKWNLWDKAAEALADDGEVTSSAEALVQESFGQAAWKLADILLQLMANAESEPLFKDQIAPRLETVMNKPGKLAQYAKIRLAIDLGYVVDRAPNWSEANLIPLFDWTSPDAPAVWHARQFSRYIGGPKLFRSIKPGFLELFSRADVSDEALRSFAGWMVSILLANRKNSGGYDLNFIEARATLRRTRPTVLVSIAHDFAEEMQRAAPASKLAVWRDSVGPVFDGIWPKDVDLLSGDVTFKLLQILRATGEAFPLAAEVIEPFIVPEGKEQGTAAYSLGNADDVLFRSAPRKMLDIVAAVVGKRPPGSVFQLQKVLDRITACEPALVNTKKYQSLRQMAR